MVLTQDDNEVALSIEKTTGTTGPGLIVFGDGAHNVGIGTATPQDTLHVVGNIVGKNDDMALIIDSVTGIPVAGISADPW